MCVQSVHSGLAKTAKELLTFLSDTLSAHPSHSLARRKLEAEEALEEGNPAKSVSSLDQVADYILTAPGAPESHREWAAHCQYLVQFGPSRIP